MVNDDDIKNAVVDLKRQQLQSSLYVGTQSQPDTEAKLQALARRTGLPVDVVRIKQPEVELHDKLQSFDYEKINKETPKTAAFLSNPNNAAIAHDDVESMGQIERTLKGTLGDVGVVATKGSIGLVQAAVGLLDIPTMGLVGKGYELLGLDFKEAQEIANTLYSPAQQRAQQAVQNADGFIDTVGAAVSNPSTIATAFGESIPQMLGGAAIARGAVALLPKLSPLVAGAIGEGVISAGSAAESFRGQTDDGLLTLKQTTSAVGSGTMTAVFGLMGGKLAQRFGIDDVDAALARGGFDKPAMESVKTGFVKSLVGGGISEGVFEELPQSMQEQMWHNFAMGRPIGEGVGNAAAMGLLSGGVMGGGFQLVRHFANSEKAQKAETGAAMLDQISELAQASKLAQRNPESFQQFIAAAAENGPVENVYIDAKTLAQSGIAGELAKISPAVAEQLDRALVGNSQVAIPIAEYAAKIAPSEYAQALRSHLRTDPEGYTPAEAEAYMKEAAPQLQAEMAKVLESKNVDDTFKQSMGAVKQIVLDEMNAAGRFTPAKNEADATLVASYYAVRAQQLGITPEELFNRRRVRVSAEPMTGKAYNAGDNLPTAAELLDPANIPESLRDMQPGMTVDVGEDFTPAMLKEQAGGLPEPGSPDAGTQAKTPPPNRMIDTLFQSAFHGSPFRFDKFTLDHIGKGEGAQAYGYGLYFAGNKEVAEWYRNGLTQRKPESVELELTRQGVSQETANTFAQYYVSVGRGGAGGTLPFDGFAKMVEEKSPSPYIESFRERVRAELPVLKDAISNITGQLYEVNIPEDDTMLLWDKPLSEQPESVRKALKEYIDKIVPIEKQEQFYRMKGRLYSEATTPLRWSGETLYNHIAGELNAKHDSPKSGNRQASEYLNTLGITGIKYLDGTSRDKGEGSFNYVIFDDSAIEILKTYYQSEGAAPNRGAFNPETLQITLLKNADLSTFLHESGHFFFENDIALASELVKEVEDITKLTHGEQQIVKDVSGLLKWHGIQGTVQEQLAQWHNMSFEERRSSHERTAESFEKYLIEGKAPSIELAPYFQTFRAWLLNVYKSLKDFLAGHPEAGQLNDEVRGIFDRMLATDDQIALAEQGRSMMPLFTTAEEAGWTPKRFAEYQATGKEATATAMQELDSKGLKDMQWIQNKRGKVLKKLQKEHAEKRREVRAAVRVEVMSQPVYRAWQFLTKKMSDTVNQEAADSGRIDRLLFDEIDLPPDTREKIIIRLEELKMLKKDAMPPDVIAEVTGFNSGDEMVRALAVAPTPKEAIEAATDQRMLETYGELSQPGALERAADLAIHNEVRTKMYVTEANALAKATGKPKILVEAAKNFAAEMIARKKIKDIRPLEYTHAETRAAKLAAKAMRAGDLETAASEARNKVINAYAVKAAYAAQEEARSIQKKWAQFANRSDKKLGKAYDIDLVNAVRAVLGEYGIAPRMAKKGSEYLKAVERYDPETFSIVQQSVAQAEANAKPVKELTMEELRGLRDEIDSIIHLAKRMHQSEVDGKLLDIQDIETELMDRMTDIGVPGQVPGEGQAVTPSEQRMTKLKSLLSFARRMESWSGMMDGAAQMGPFRRYIWNRISDAAIKYRTDKGKYLKQYRDLIKTIAPTLKSQIIAAPELGYVFGKDSGGSAVNEIVHAILHTGNESNKRKLLLGRGWATELPDGTLNTSRWDRFINRMIQEGKINKAHFDFAQGVWDLLESTKELAQKTHRDVFGKYFDEVTATSFQTPFGNYRGGYVPAMVDSRVVKDAAMRALADQDNSAMSYAFPTTPKGFIKTRVEYNKPLTLDLRTLAQHIDKVLLFSHMEMPVRDVQRIMSKQVGETLNRIDPTAIPSMITPWLNRSAKQQVETPISGDAGTMRFFSVMRSRAGMAAMFGNLANTVQQITGFSLASVKVKPKLLLGSTADYLKAPREFTAAVADASPYMATRMENEVAVMNGEISDILLNPSLIEKGQAWTMRHAYFLQAAVDNVMSPIIWTAAYNQAKENGADHVDAVRLGDSAVRETQGSMQAEDISRIESGNAFVRMFTQFAGYFNMNANLLGTGFAKLMQDGGLRNNAGKGLYLYTFGLMIPAVVGELIIQIFRGGPDDEDKDGEYLDDWIASVFGWGQLRYVTAMIPVAGQAANAFANAGNAKPYDDRIATSPAISMLESAARAPWSVYNAATGEASAQKAVKDVATLISMTLGLPANFIARPVGYMAGVADDKINPTGPVDTARGLMTGFASYESREK